MGKETSIFDEIGRQIQRKRLVEKLNCIAEFVKKKYDANIWFVKIFGKRWSYIAGKEGDFSIPTEQVQLSGRIGLVSDSLEKIPHREEFIAFLKQVVEENG